MKDKILAKKLLEEDKYNVNKSKKESFKNEFKTKAKDKIKTKEKTKILKEKNKYDFSETFKLDFSKLSNIKDKITTKKVALAASFLLIFVFGVTILNVTMKVLSKDESQTIVSTFNEEVDIYEINNEIINQEEIVDNDSIELLEDEIIDEETNALQDEDTNIYVEEISDGDITFTYIGEIMMGGVVTENLSYMYNMAFKQIYNYTRYSDYTYTVLTTAITSLSEIENASSQYLVTEDILSALNALGVDCVSLASDHMTQFSQIIFNNTVSSLRENNFSISGMDDNIVYTEIEDKRVAIISATNSYLDSKTVYEEYGINIYDEDKMKSDILSAKANADFVIVDVHWGLLASSEVTYEMEEIAMLAIDNGADLVLGSHSLGAKPVTIYNDKPIIYSAGYLITYSELEEAKRSYVYDIDINSDNEIETITMTPMYTVDQTTVMLYAEYDEEEANSFNESNKLEMESLGLECEIIDNKIVVNF